MALTLDEEETVRDCAPAGRRGEGACADRVGVASGTRRKVEVLRDGAGLGGEGGGVGFGSVGGAVDVLASVCSESTLEVDGTS